jgi:hypothetical protein
MNPDPYDCFEGTEPATRRHQIDMLSGQQDGGEEPEDREDEDGDECDECGALIYSGIWCEDCMAKADEEPTVLMEEESC